MVRIGHQPVLHSTSYTVESTAEKTQQYSIYHGIGGFLNDYQEPIFVLNSDIIRAKWQELRQAMPRVIPHYAVQANAHRAVLKTLQEENVVFAAQSIAEIRQLLDVGIKPEAIEYINPVKSRTQIEWAAEHGIIWFVIDSIDELRKISYLKPDAKLYLRIDTPALGHLIPHPVKYGAAIAETSAIIQEAVQKGVDLAGVAFHAGTQCLHPENWQIGIARAKLVLNEMRRAGLHPCRLNIGGGFPVSGIQSVPKLESYTKVINQAITTLDPTIEVVAEPGRYVVAEAGIILGQVIGIARRDRQRWLYTDIRLSDKLVDHNGNLCSLITTDRSGPLAPWALVGAAPNDSDIPVEEVMLPRYLQEGDYLYFHKAGAYPFDGHYASHNRSAPVVKVIGSGPRMKILTPGDK
jgi:ornithine decarboxylase